MLSIRVVGSHGYPALGLGDHLHHSLRLAICILMLNVTILRIVHKSKVSRHILLISVNFRATFLSGQMVQSTLFIVPRLCCNLSKISKHPLVGIVWLIIMRYGEFPLKDLLSLANEAILQLCGAIEVPHGLEFLGANWRSFFYLASLGNSHGKFETVSNGIEGTRVDTICTARVVRGG